MSALALLIIGYGSPIRGDDALGPLVADHLMQAGLPAGIGVISRHELTAELVTDLARAERVLFLDASIEGEPGEIRYSHLLPGDAANPAMAHFLTPQELLAWCQGLYGHCPRAELLSVCGESFDYAHYQLTPTVTAVLPALLQRIGILIEETAPGAEA